jgi:hypothetical protein
VCALFLGVSVPILFSSECIFGVILFFFDYLCFYIVCVLDLLCVLPIHICTLKFLLSFSYIFNIIFTIKKR